MSATWIPAGHILGAASIYIEGQRERLLMTREVIGAGGKVLDPAFAVGRSQEVILILSRAIRRGQVPAFPVFVDGMVWSVNAVYASLPADRERVLNGSPCCIVASSGVLIGGAENLIAITGYQDEESPGRALLDLAQAEEAAERTLMLNGQQVPVACRVETYSLSAHVDSG